MPRTTSSEYALIIQHASGAQLVLNSLLRLLLNFQYGLQIMVSRSRAEAGRRLDHYQGQIRCVFWLGDAEAEDMRALSSGRPQLFFALVPAQLAALHRTSLADLAHLRICAIESAFGKGENALLSQVTDAFAVHGIDDLLGPEDLPYAQQRLRAEQRLDKLHTLPTLPEVVVQIMRLVEDPETTIKDLETWLLRDPAIVLKLRRILASPAFAADRQSEWTLQESIMRVGLKKVGAIAQQIELMNGLIQPRNSAFDLERFWKHSLACALIANRLCADALIPAGGLPGFNAYWMGSILHDIGKLVLGFFFPVRYQAICDHIRANEGTPFRKAEARLGNIAPHDYLARLLLLKSGVAPEIVEAVGTHHHGRRATPLAGVIHLANGLSKDMGFGCLPGERGSYSAATIRNLGLDAAALAALRQELAPRVGEEVEAMMAQCRPDPAAHLASAAQTT